MNLDITTYLTGHHTVMITVGETQVIYVHQCQHCHATFSSKRGERRRCPNEDCRRFTWKTGRTLWEDRALRNLAARQAQAGALKN